MGTGKPGEQPDYDWVTQRADCSTFKVFKNLEMQAESNVQQRNKLRSEGDRIKFAFARNRNAFVVLEESSHRSVHFDLGDGGEIAITGDGIQGTITATLTLMNTGDCLLAVKGEELLPWQVLRMALEELFFSEPRQKP